ncbi:MAG: hypothetical protein HY543_06015 [Deltaproteobacteria bacterium]|nr:hypothetical protein [Deltaproteobacteria bacterium]
MKTIMALVALGVLGVSALACNQGPAPAQPTAKPTPAPVAPPPAPTPAPAAPAMPPAEQKPAGQ